MNGNIMINLIIWLMVGAIIGWAAGLVMKDRNGVVVNIIVGVVGAMIGGLLLGGSTMNQNAFHLTALFVSFVGAVMLLGVVNLVRRGRLTELVQPFNGRMMVRHIHSRRKS